jgi:hypothetical protein
MHWPGTKGWNSYSTRSRSPPLISIFAKISPLSQRLLARVEFNVPGKTQAGKLPGKILQLFANYHFDKN